MSSAAASPDLDSNANLESPSKQTQRRSLRDHLRPNFSDRPSFKTWLRRSWLDLFTQLQCSTLVLLIFLFVPPLFPRRFPLYPGYETSEFAIKHGRPLQNENIDSIWLQFAICMSPILFMSMYSMWGRYGGFWDEDAAVCLAPPISFCTSLQKTHPPLTQFCTLKVEGQLE